MAQTHLLFNICMVFYFTDHKILKLRVSSTVWVSWHAYLLEHVKYNLVVKCLLSVSLVLRSCVSVILFNLH